VNVPQPAEPLGRRAELFRLGQNELSGFSDHHLLDVTPAVDEKSDLPADLPGYVGEIPREFRGYDDIKGEAPAVDPLQALELAGLEAECVSVDLLDLFTLFGRSLSIKIIRKVEQKVKIPASSRVSLRLDPVRVFFLGCFC